MELDNIFRDKLQNREDMPSDAVWAKLSKMLDEQEEAIIVPLAPVAKKALGWRIYSVAASVLILVAVLAVWTVGRQGNEQLAQSKTQKKQRIEAGKTEKESVERLAQNDTKEDKTAIEDETHPSNTETQPEPKPKSTQTTPQNQNKPATKTPQNQTTPKNQQKTTPPTPTKPKTFKPLPSHTELIAGEYEIKFKRVRIELIPEHTFDEAVVTLILDEPPVLPKVRKRKKPKRHYFAEEDTQKTKRKFKLIDRSKMYAILED